MLQYLFAFVVMIVVFTGMMLALTFSKYKQKGSGCCGGGHCSMNTHSSGNNCYNDKITSEDKYPNKS